MAPFLGGLVDWPLHTSAINAIQLSNKCQLFQLRTNWWCSLATFAQFLSHEQQHFQNLSLKLRFLHFLQKIKQDMYRYVTTLPLCYKSTKLQMCCIFSLQIILFVHAAFEWPQQFWSSEVHQIRHGKIDSEAPFNTISMTEIPLFLAWSVLGHVKTGNELCKCLFCCIRSMLIALWGVSNREYPLGFLGASQWRFLLLCCGGLLEEDINLHDNKIMINDIYQWQIYIYNVKQLNTHKSYQICFCHMMLDRGHEMMLRTPVHKSGIVHLSVLLQVAKPKLQKRFSVARLERSTSEKVPVLMSSAHNMYQHGICRKEDHRKSILTFVGLKNYAQSRTANGASTGPNSRIFIGPYLSGGAVYRNHNN